MLRRAFCPGVMPKVVKSIRERSIMVNALVWLVDQAMARVKAIARVATNATLRLVFMGMLLFLKKSNRSARHSSSAVALTECSFSRLRGGEDGKGARVLLPRISFLRDLLAGRMRTHRYTAESGQLKSSTGDHGYCARGVCSIVADDVIPGGLSDAGDLPEASVGIVGHNGI